MPKHSSVDRLTAIYRIYACCVACVLIVVSEQVAFWNSGDFIRTVGFMLDKPLDETGRLWTFRADGMQRLLHFDAAGYVFGLFGYLQKWTSGVYYDLRWHSITVKVVLLLLSHLVAKRLCATLNRGSAVQALLFTLLSLTLFQAHHIGIVKSFYGEYLAFLGCVLLVLGLLSPEGRPRLLAVLLGALVLGAAKVQYFYVPALLLVCLLWRRQMPGPHRTQILLGLIFVQGLCLTPLSKNPYQQLNYHQSTYFGSYLVLSHEELRGLGLNERQLECVGIDAWGHRAKGPGGSYPEPGADTCYGKGDPLTLSDVLAPYVAYPTTLWRLAIFALPHHFTVQYYHVYRELVFTVPADRLSFRAAQPLVSMTKWREATITRAWLLVVVCGLLAGIAAPRRQSALALTALFLVLFISSQIVISLLGEGIRDLSKHLWAAQLALDLLVIILGVQVTRWLMNPKQNKMKDLPTP